MYDPFFRHDAGIVLCVNLRSLNCQCALYVSDRLFRVESLTSFRASRATHDTLNPVVVSTFFDVDRNPLTRLHSYADERVVQRMCQPELFRF